MPHSLLRSQKNDILPLIQNSKLNPNEFVWSIIVSGFTHLEVPILRHKPSEYYFIFDFSSSSGRHVYQYSPGQDKILESGYAGPWRDQLAYFNLWLSSLKVEIEAPDLWKSLNNAQEFIDGVSEKKVENSKFSPDEQKAVLNLLMEIKENLLTVSKSSNEQKKIIEENFEHLKGALSNFGKKDWLLLFLGTAFQWIASGVLPPDQIQGFLIFAMTKLNTVYHIAKSLTYIKI